MTEPEPDVPEDEDWSAPAELAPDVVHDLAELDDRPIVVSAFAGIGGLDEGFRRAGYQSGVQIEWDAAASRVLAARFPRAARYGDVRHVNGHAVRHSIRGRRVCVLCGGFPCQDLSVAGLRAGLVGDRSGLYGELLRLTAEIDPDWLVVENVPGLLSADADPTANDGNGYGPGTGFALFLGDLTGYRPPVPEGGWRNSGVCHGPLGTCAWRVLDARHFGVAQRRRRVFVVFHPRDRRAPAAVLLESEGVRRDPAARRPSWQVAADALVDAPVPGGGGGPDRAGEDRARAEMTPTWAPEVSVPLGALTGGQRQDLEGMTYVPVATNALDGDVAKAVVAAGAADPHDYSQSTYVAVTDIAATLRAADGPHGPSHGLRGDGSDNLIIGHVEASGGDDVAPTVTSKWAKGRGGPAGSETGNLVVGVLGEQTHTLTAEGADASEDGTGRGTPVVVVGSGREDVAHAVTASGTDGMGRGVPAVVYRKSRRAATNEDDETWVEADHANTLNLFDGGDSRATEVIIETPAAIGVHVTQDPIHVYEGTPALGAKSGGQGVLGAAAAVRRLTPRECERLQGFPDDWTLVRDAKGRLASDSPRYKQLGNAVCVNVAEWIACRIHDYDDGVLG